MDSYDSILNKINDGEDEKGKYKLMELIQEVPCGCHPETCCHFNHKTSYSTFYKKI